VTGHCGYGGGSNHLWVGKLPGAAHPFNDRRRDVTLCGTGAILKACKPPFLRDRINHTDSTFVRTGGTNSPRESIRAGIYITAIRAVRTIPVHG